MEKILLNNGIEIPALGYGVFQIEDTDICEQCVVDAIQLGYRLIDTAAAYRNEEAVGRAVKRCGVPREELFITTKIWISDAGYESAKKAFESSMERLGLDYLDMYLIHRPFGDYYGTWRAMEELYKEGKIRAIGVCNFTMDRLVDLIAHQEIPPVVNQIETHPIFQQKELRGVMEEYHVAHEAWAPFSEGKNNIFTNEMLTKIGGRYKKTVAQVILRWHIQRGSIVIPKSARKERIEENYNIWDFALTEEDMKQIELMDTNKSTFSNQITDLDTVKHWCSFRV